MAIAAFCNAASQMVNRIDLLEKHRRWIVKRQLRRLKLPKNTTAIDFVLRASEAAGSSMKDEAFFILLSSILKEPVEKVKRLYEECCKLEWERGVRRRRR